MAIYAIENPTFQPAMRIITNITNASHAVVTTSFNHDYFTGDIVRIYIPKDYGMQEINRLFAPITIIDDTNFYIDINTNNFSVFTIPVAYEEQPQVVPIGEVNSTVYGATKNVLREGNR